MSIWTPRLIKQFTICIVMAKPPISGLLKLQDGTSRLLRLCHKYTRALCMVELYDLIDLFPHSRLTVVATTFPRLFLKKSRFFINKTTFNNRQTPGALYFTFNRLLECCRKPYAHRGAKLPRAQAQNAKARGRFIKARRTIYKKF